MKRAVLALVLVLAVLQPGWADIFPITRDQFGPSTLLESFEGTPNYPNVTFSSNQTWPDSMVLPAKVISYDWPSGLTYYNPVPNLEGPFLSQNMMLDATKVAFGLGTYGTVPGSRVPDGTHYFAQYGSSSNPLPEIRFSFPPSRKFGGYFDLATQYNTPANNLLNLYGTNGQLLATKTLPGCASTSFKTNFFGFESTGDLIAGVGIRPDLSNPYASNPVMDYLMFEPVPPPPEVHTLLVSSMYKDVNGVWQPGSSEPVRIIAASNAVLPRAPSAPHDAFMSRYDNGLVGLGQMETDLYIRQTPFGNQGGGVFLNDRYKAEGRPITSTASWLVEAVANNTYVGDWKLTFSVDDLADKNFFGQWLVHQDEAGWFKHRAGAPDFDLGDVLVSETPDGGFFGELVFPKWLLRTTGANDWIAYKGPRLAVEVVPPGNTLREPGSSDIYVGPGEHWMIVPTDPEERLYYLQAGIQLSDTPEPGTLALLAVCALCLLLLRLRSRAH